MQRTTSANGVQILDRRQGCRPNRVYAFDLRPIRIGHKVQVGASIGIVKELSLFWTELMTGGKVQIIVRNGGVWGQQLGNLSIYPAPPPVLEMRFRIAESTELAPAIENVRAIVEAHPRVLADLAPSVLLDQSGSDNAIEILVTCSTVEGGAAAVRSDLIKAVHTALDHDSDKLAAQ